MQQLTTVPNLKYDQVLLSHFLGEKNKKNKQLVAKILHTKQRIFYVYGQIAMGKTHLLKAYCTDAIEHELQAVYYDCTQTLTQSQVDEFIQMDWICIDNIHLSDNPSQYALYSLYNAAQLHNKVLILSADEPVNQLAMSFKDLKTRLSLSHILPLEVLDNTQKKQVMMQKMQMQNIQISKSIYDYLLQYYSRNLSVLVGLLFKINKQAILKHKKQITLGFVKSFLNEIDEI